MWLFFNNLVLLYIGSYCNLKYCLKLAFCMHAEFFDIDYINNSLELTYKVGTISYLMCRTTEINRTNV